MCCEVMNTEKWQNASEKTIYAPKVFPGIKYILKHVSNDIIT